MNDDVRERLLAALGIDPDLPAEWATVDHCLTWLRDREHFGLTVIDGGYGVEWRQADLSLHVVHAPTLHAALIVACRAVQEAS